MDDETEYRIEFTIQRKQPGDEDFTDIGFGSSGGWHSSIEAAEFTVGSMIQNWQWETQPGMPDPEELRIEARDGAVTTAIDLCKHNLPTQGARRCHFCRDGREPGTGMCTCSCGCARVPMADPGVWAECYCWCHTGTPVTLPGEGFHA